MRQFRPLMPSEELPLAGPSSLSQVVLPKRQRVSTSAACQPCRRRKLKCGGQRPACHPCLRAGITCSYVTAAGETHQEALKRKHQDVLSETEQLRELFNLLHTRPQTEALAILNRIRTTNDPIAVLSSVKAADLLQPNPNPDGPYDAQLEKLEDESLKSSCIKVPSRPWTIVVGDGIVSELISAFFTNDHEYLVPFIHRGAFIKDMRSQSAHDSTYCSPLLVNAICALKCLTCQGPKKMGRLTGQQMVERFLSESKKLLELERGVETLPTVQALCIMYLTSALLGRDRAGLMYRYTAYEMLRRQRLEAYFAKLDSQEPEEAQTRQIISKVLWGFFCFEGRMAYFYSEPSLLRTPTIPNLFDESSDVDEDVHQEKAASALHYSPTPSLFKTLCTLSELFYEIMLFNSNSTALDSEESLSKRADLYTRFEDWRTSLPENLQVEKNFTVHTCYLHLHISETAYSILQLLPPTLVLSSEEVSVRELCVMYCESDGTTVERYMKKWAPDPLLGRGLFVSLCILASYLDDTSRHIHFTRQCAMLRACLVITPLVKLLLKGVQATVWGLKKEIPHEARPYFQGLDEEVVDVDLPVSFSLPHRDEIRLLLSGEHQEHPDDLGVRLSVLVSRWTKLSVNSI